MNEQGGEIRFAAAHFLSVDAVLTEISNVPMLTPPPDCSAKSAFIGLQSCNPLNRNLFVAPLKV